MNNYQNLFNEFIEKIEPNYFKWNKYKQNDFKNENLDMLMEEYENYLRLKLFDIKERFFSDDPIENMFNKNADLTEEQLYDLNHAMQYLYGIGENLFWLNEQKYNDKLSRNCSNFYEYAKYDFEERQKLEKEINPAYQEKEFKEAELDYFWVRIVEEDKLKFFTIVNAKKYIFDTVNQEVEQYIRELFTRNKDYKINKAFSELKNKAFEKVELEIKKLSDLVYYTNVLNEEYEKFLIFSNDSVAKKISLENFLSDVDKYKTTDMSDIENIIESAKEEIKKEIDLIIKQEK